jgi:hypothetical protein
MLVVDVTASYPNRPDCPYTTAPGFNLTSAAPGQEGAPRASAAGRCCALAHSHPPSPSASRRAPSTLRWPIPRPAFAHRLPPSPLPLPQPTRRTCAPPSRTSPARSRCARRPARRWCWRAPAWPTSPAWCWPTTSAATPPPRRRAPRPARASRWWWCPRSRGWTTAAMTSWTHTRSTVSAPRRPAGPRACSCAGARGAAWPECMASPLLSPSHQTAPVSPPPPAATCRPSEQPTCPEPPQITCPSPPVCSQTGDLVSLAGSCVSSDPNATLVYSIHGDLTLTATCPRPGKSRKVSVTASYTSRPDCSYDKQRAYRLSGAPGGGGRCARRGPGIAHRHGGERDGALGVPPCPRASTGRWAAKPARVLVPLTPPPPSSPYPAPASPRPHVRPGHVPE